MSSTQPATERFSDLQAQCLREVDEKLEQWNGFKSDYEKLKSQLETLADEMSYECFVPLGKKALMPGKLIHTNEILVLLGDNWFVETSAKSAAGIVSRRQRQCEEMIARLKEERLQYLAREEFLDKTNLKNEDESMEFTETISEGEHEEWMAKHEENLRREKLEAKRIREQTVVNMEDIFSKFITGSDDSSLSSSSSPPEPSPPLFPNNSEDSNNDKHVEVERKTKNVRWFDDDDSSRTKISFKHSPVKSTVNTFDDEEVEVSSLHPGSIHRYLSHTGLHQPVSILKNTSHQDDNTPPDTGVIYHKNVSTDPVDNINVGDEDECLAVLDEVKEKIDNKRGGERRENSTSKQRQSLFKNMRSSKQ